MQNETLHIVEAIAEPAWMTEKLIPLDLDMAKEGDPRL